MRDGIKQKLIRLQLEEIEKERNGELIERIHLQKSIEMLIEVGIQSRKIYEQEFESALIVRTRDYYRNESNQFISQNSCNAYLMKANARLTEESDRVNSYLHHSSQDKILNEFLREYIENHATTLLKNENSGLLHMLKNDQFSDIKLMYSLFKRCPQALAALKIELKAYIVAEGLTLIRNEGIQNDELVKKLIQFKERMQELLVRSLEKDQNVDLTIRDSFE